MGELRAAMKGITRRPFHTTVAVVILALGLAAGMGVYTYANGFRQPFPGADAHGLVRLFEATPADPFGNVSYLDYLDYAAAVGGTFRGLAAAQAGYAASVRFEASTEVVFLEAVSGSYFPVLGVEMSLGRQLTPEDDQPGAEPVAVISYAWWQRHWNGDPSIIGSVVYFNFRPHTVVGVASPRFLGSLASYRPDAWLPFEPFKARYTSWARASEDRDVPLVRVLGRLQEGADIDRATGEMERVAAGLDEIHPLRDARARRATLARATWIDPRARVSESGTVRLMTAAAVAFLLLVCANVGNLLLAVAAGRRREMALRAALGASRGGLLRQLLLESLLLGGAAGVVALALAGPVATRLGSYFARPSVWGANVARQTAVDGYVVLGALALAVVASLLAGLPPALTSSRRNLAEALKEQTAGGRPPTRRVGRFRLPEARDLMVSAQVGLSVVLLTVAALTLRTLANVGAIDPGFEVDPLLASYISTSSTGVTVEERDLWFRTLAERLSEEPWVRSATISNQAPLSPHGARAFRLENDGDDVDLTYATVIPGYFETLGMRILRGRDFAEADTAGAPGVAIVNEALVRRHFPGSDGLGRRVWLAGADGGAERAFEVVGVVNDARVQDFLAEPEPVVYLANPQQSYASGSALTVATTIEAAAAVPRLYQWLRAYESHIAIVNVLPYTEVVRGSTYAQRMNAQMFSALAFLGLVLAAAGIFGVMSLAVSQRTREIGLRMAVGARGADIARLVMRRAGASVGLGLVVGLAASLALAGLARGILFGVRAADPSSVAGACAVLLATALLAALLPARRAAAVDPIRSLRAD